MSLKATSQQTKEDKNSAERQDDRIKSDSSIVATNINKKSLPFKL